MAINWNRRKYSEQEFRSAWLSSYSIAEAARKLNLNIFGSTYLTMKSTAEELGLSQEHMTGQGWNTGDRGGFVPKPARPLEEVLVYGKYENTSNLKRRLMSEGIKIHMCEMCWGQEWLGKPIPISLDHEDGDRLNNRLENLRFLCYNCHGQTETYCRKK
jgi:hypothetical protein